MCVCAFSQVSLCSVSIPQWDPDPYEDEDRVSEHPEALQRQPHALRQGDRLHLLLLLQGAGEVTWATGTKPTHTHIRKNSYVAPSCVDVP